MVLAFRNMIFVFTCIHFSRTLLSVFVRTQLD